MAFRLFLSWANGNNKINNNAITQLESRRVSESRNNSLYWHAAYPYRASISAAIIIFISVIGPRIKPPVSRITVLHVTRHFWPPVVDQPPGSTDSANKCRSINNLMIDKITRSQCFEMKTFSGSTFNSISNEPVNIIRLYRAKRKFIKQPKKTIGK